MFFELRCCEGCSKEIEWVGENLSKDHQGRGRDIATISGPEILMDARVSHPAVSGHRAS